MECFRSFQGGGRRVDFVFDDGEIVVAHEAVGRGILSIVRMRQIRVRIHVGVALVRQVQIGSGAEYRPALQVVTNAERLFGDVEFFRTHVPVAVDQFEKEGAIGADVTALVAHYRLAGRWQCPRHIRQSAAHLKQTIFPIGFINLFVISPKNRYDYLNSI